MSATRYAGFLSWRDTRRAAAALETAWRESGRRLRDVAAALGWSEGKVSAAVHAVARMTPADARALADELGADLGGLGLAGPDEPELANGNTE